MNFKKKHPLDRDLALRLYYEGRTDEEIASECDVVTQTIERWRREIGLAPNVKPKRKAPMSKLAIAVAEARRRGLSYGQYMANRLY